MSDRGSAAERIEYRRQNAVDPEAFLIKAGVVEPTDGGENLRFTADFRTRLDEHVAAVRSDGATRADVATMFGVAVEDVCEADRSYTAFKTNNRVRNWPSEAALVLDIAVDSAIRETPADWEAVPVRQRHRMLQSLRSFQQTCLFCSGTVSMNDRVVESCCGDQSVVTVSCTDCDRRFLEFSADSV